LQFFSQGQYRSPLVVRIAGYAYQEGFGGHFHNDNSVAALRDIPGLIIASPSRPDDAAAMLRTCLAAAETDGSVCVFLEPIALYHMRDLHEPGDGGWLAPYPEPGRWAAGHVPAGRARTTSGFVDLEPLARASGVPVWRCADLADPAAAGHVRVLRPDLIVVAGWTRLLPAALLAVPPRGCVGFHASLLPRYRGRAPVNWAIIRGDAATGNTMMYLDATADTGDVIDQRPVPIGPGDTCATVYARVGEAGAAMLRQHLAALLVGTAARRPQGPASGPPLPKRTPAAPAGPPPPPSPT